jgi:isoquinoline 1-oxidoreductase alpha subunit
MAISFTVNGKRTQFSGDPDMPLLWALRDEVGLTGTKYGCGIAQCGACTVFVDGAATRACATPVSAVEGQSVTTIEGVAGDKGAAGRAARAVQAAWRKLDVVQCGYCQSGQIMSATALLVENAKPSDADIDAAMDGNLCRCATYQRIRAAIHEAARSLEG